MRRLLASLAVCLLLSGCWDQVQLNKQLFVDITGIDYNKGDGKRLKVSYVVSELSDTTQGGGKPSDSYLESTGANIYETVSNINKEMPGTLSVLETRLYLIGAEFAKDQPMDYLNNAAQFETLYADLVLYDGDLPKLLAKKEINGQTTSDFLVGLLEDEKRRGRIPSNKLFHYILGGEGFMNDFLLNRFEPFGNGARLAGTALFRDGKYTGVNLNNDETLLALLMKGAPAKGQLFFGPGASIPYSARVRKRRGVTVLPMTAKAFAKSRFL
ncbi:hypothetical protein [Paenibacillus sacheonensis]|uniref:Ger(x)C family spore germination protein n=1 Tax=Paenibacillus sacheonensis TaxID=742054 RepID=UPI001EF8AC34|nr:hypothetical protein [Paenibacillus sacheonensis]MBM7563950.1 hypothetical protein [Paenibacillus sacheonensis]